MLTTYFGLLAALAAHPAITVSTFPLKMVAAAVRNSELHVRHPAPFEAALHGLVELVFGRLPRVSDPFVDDVVLAGHISAKFSELDFDDEDDYKDFYGLQRAQVMMAIQELTKLRPLEMMRLCHGKLLDLNTNGAGARCGETGGASAEPTPSHSGARCCWRPRCCAHHRTRSPSRRSPP